MIRLKTLRKTLATYYQKCWRDKNSQDENSPSGTTSLCSAGGGGELAGWISEVFVQDPPLHLVVPKTIKLSKDEFAERCLDKFFRTKIKIAIKNCFCMVDVIQVATYCAVCTYNGEASGILNILKANEITRLRTGTGEKTRSAWQLLDVVLHW